LNPLPSWLATAQSLLELLYPPRCVVCRSRGSWYCSACQQHIEFIQPPFCHLCGQSTSAGQLCRSCSTRPLRIDGIRAVGYLEGGLRTAIHRFKYSNLRPLAQPLGRLAAEYLSRNPLPVEALVPVPLHAGRLRERGYNQAALLARQIGDATCLPVVVDALARVKSTAPQVGLSAAQRRQNVEGAFHCSRTIVAGKNVLLVDDVCTTGSTLEACAIALQQAGVGQVWALVLARERWMEQRY
jgi:ComF family protein